MHSCVIDCEDFKIKHYFFSFLLINLIKTEPSPFKNLTLSSKNLSKPPESKFSVALSKSFENEYKSYTPSPTKQYGAYAEKYKRKSKDVRYAAGAKR